jgi:hypothetical protein
MIDASTGPYAALLLRIGLGLLFLASLFLLLCRADINRFCGYECSSCSRLT